MNSIYKIVIPSLFFIQYLGIGVVAQIIIFLLIIFELLRGSTFVFSDADKILFSGIFILFFFKMFGVPIEVNLHLLRFYWGFAFFLLFFLISGYKPNFHTLFWLTIIFTLIEALLINTIVPLAMMKNIPASHLEVLEYEAKWMVFKRAYGLASSPTASASIIVILLACVYKLQNQKFKNWYMILTLLVLVVMGSGTGFLLFLIFLMLRYKLLTGIRMFWGILFLSGFAIFVKNQVITEGGLLMRLSGDYFTTLFELKGVQINEVIDRLSHSVFQVFFGANYKSIPETRVFSDFGWIDFIECYGVFGITLFLFYIFMKQKLSIAPIILFYLGYFHYAAIGTIPGQILFGAILAHFVIKKSKTIAQTT